MSGLRLGLGLAARSDAPAAVAAAASSTQWRTKLTGYPQAGSGTDCGLVEMEMMDVVAGADQCTGGTPVTSDMGYNPALLFDNDAFSGTVYIDRPNNNSGYFGYTFAVAKTIVQVTMTVALGARGPTTFDVQYFDGSVWVTSWSVTAGVWADGEKKTFVKP